MNLFNLAYYRIKKKIGGEKMTYPIITGYINMSTVEEIENERERQVKKFGIQNLNDLESLSITMEELGEVAMIETKNNIPPIENVGGLQNELLQTITVLVAWYERVKNRKESEEEK